MRSPRPGRAPGSPATKCHLGLTRGGPAGPGTAAPGPPPPPPFAARPPGSDTLFFGTGRLCAGRAQGREAAAVGREEPPAPPALRADPRLKPAPLWPPPAWLFTVRLPPFLASTPGRRQASPLAPRGLPRGHPRQACLVCPWARPGTRCPQVGGGDTTAEAASSVYDPGAWCQRDLEFPVWLVLGPVEPG